MSIVDISFSKYFNRLNTTDNWKRHLIDFVKKANLEGRSVVVIAIARKMARLFEYYRKTDSYLDLLFDKSKSTSTLNYIITEHAIPLCLAQVNQQQTEIIILDDLIISGDTVESVTENVYHLSGIKPNIIAMAATYPINYKFQFGQVLYPVICESKLKNPDILDKEEIPAFTAKNNWDIISLGKSIDLEHTILKIKGDFSYLKYQSEKILAILQKTFEKDTVVYPVSHRIPGGQESLSFSIIFDKNSKYRINDDFSKIRIFIGEEGISITSYTPNYWDESILEDDSVRFGVKALNQIWEEVRSNLLPLKMLGNPASTDIKKIRMSREFKQRVEQTAVVIANYLLSFESVMIIKSLLQDAFTQIIGENPNFEISSGDMSLLMGSNIANKYQPRLKEVIAQDTVNRFIIYNKSLEEEIRIKPLTPSDKNDDYRKEKLQMCHLSSSVPMALTLIFYTMWKSFGLINNSIREDRIKVGETFESLYETLSIFFSKDDLLEEIHKWIDTNIDLGVVVPKYEYFIDRLGYRVWRRYFRAGERESVMTDVARAALCLATDGYGLSVGDILTESLFDNSVYPALESLSIIADGQLNLDVFKGNTRYITDLDDKSASLWIYLILIGALDVRKKDQYSIILADIEGHPLFTKTALFLQASSQ